MDLRSSTWLLLAVVIGVAADAGAASFDCAQARSRVEKLVCAAPSLSEADTRMAEAYARARTALPEPARTGLRAEQRAWVSQREACPDAACVERLSGERTTLLDRQAQAANSEFDRAVASIPQAPARAAAALRGYRNPLARAWLVYLGRFVPESGVTAAEAGQARRAAIEALAAADPHQPDVLDSIGKDGSAAPGMDDLALLRMWIEVEDYGSDARPYVHCFAFDRQGVLAYDAMGAFYGSSRDASAPLCPPEGDLFEQPGWKALQAAVEPMLQSVKAEGTMRFADYATWRSIDLMATRNPRLFLGPRGEDRYTDDPRDIFQAWRSVDGWSAGDVSRALAAVGPAHAQTARWLVARRGLDERQADVVAGRILRAWVGSRSDYVEQWGAGHDPQP